MAGPALCRGLHLAALFTAFGSLLVMRVVLPAPADAREAAMLAGLRRRLGWLGAACAAAAILLGLAWGGAVAGAMAGAASLGETLGAVPLVALHTRFGHLLLLRLAVLAAALSLSARPPRLVWTRLLLLGGTIVLQPLLGHAGAMPGGAGLGLSATEALHLLAAAAWLGGLPALALGILALPPLRGAAASERFLPVGLAGVLVLAGSGFVQASALIGSRVGLLDTTYGHIALLKLALFAVLLGLAGANRFLLAPRLRAAAATSGAGPAQRALLASIGIEAALGLAVVIAAASLASTEPAIDITHAANGDQ